MCTPVGHTLAGWIVGNRWKTRPFSFKTMFVFVFILSNLPDVDLLFGYPSGNPNHYHHTWTHSFGFAFFSGLLVWMVVQILKKEGGLRIGLLTTGIISSHLILDYFTLDQSGPYGLQLFWPLTNHFYMAPVAIFRDMYKSSDSQTFIRSLFCSHNIYTILVEIAILVPVQYLLYFCRKGMKKSRFAWRFVNPDVE